MKKFLKGVISLAVVVLIGALLVTLLKPLVAEEFNNFIDRMFHETTQSTGGTQSPDGSFVAVDCLTYTQDPESGEYRLTEEKTLSISKGDRFSVTPSVPTHYTLNTEKSVLSLDSATEGSKLLCYFDCETCIVSFAGGDGSTLISGNEIQVLRKGQTPQAPDYKRTGYTLTGFDKALSCVYEDTSYTAQWELTRFTVQLYATEDTAIGDASFARRNDTPNCFEKTYTVNDTFSLPKPTSPGYTFLSWNDAADGSGKTYTEIPAETAENTVLYAIYNVKLYSIAFSAVDGVTYPSYYLPYGTQIAPPHIAPADQKAGYGLNWYTDEAFTTLYRFSEMPKENITLYGKWELDTGTGFLGWSLDGLLQNETVDSFDELVSFVDYVRYYDFAEPVEIEVTYCTYKEVLNDLSQIDASGQFRANGSIRYAAGERNFIHESAKCYVTAFVPESLRDKEASLSTSPTTETPYRYLTEKQQGRGSAYTDFYIDSLPNAFPVSTTNQLQYVVEHGYRPIPEAGSAANRIYNAARALLNEILPANATDYEKAEAIFNYLVLNVQYDTNAANAAQENASQWPLYDAFFMEGVFEQKKAVCDGIAKAFSLLCNIEGIPCVEVTGDQHAWNRVKINNLWYVADATSGNLHINNLNRSVMDHGQFLISDKEKQDMGYSSVSYPYIQAKENGNYFQNKTVTYQGKTLDFVITTTDELATLLEYLLSLEKSLDGCSIDFVNHISGLSFDRAFQNAVGRLSVKGIAFAYQQTTFQSENSSVARIVFSSSRR